MSKFLIVLAIAAVLGLIVGTIQFFIRDRKNIR